MDIMTDVERLTIRELNSLTEDQLLACYKSISHSIAHQVKEALPQIVVSHGVYTNSRLYSLSEHLWEYAGYASKAEGKRVLARLDAAADMNYATYNLVSSEVPGEQFRVSVEPRAIGYFDGEAFNEVERICVAHGALSETLMARLCE